VAHRPRRTIHTILAWNRSVVLEEETMQRHLTRNLTALAVATLLLAAPLAASANPLLGAFDAWLDHLIDCLAPAPDGVFTKGGPESDPNGTPAPAPECEGCTSGGADSDPDGTP
jgi:hypothetical protein